MTNTFGEFFVFRKDKIGQGGYGVVFRAKNVNTEELIAAKQIDIAIEDSKKRALVIEKANLEAENMLHCSHANILKLYEFSMKEKSIWLFMEFADLGDLNNFFVENEVDDQKLLKCALDITSGISFLHEKSLIHRDIKPQNILLFSVKNMMPVAKVADFGLSKVISDCTGVDHITRMQYSTLNVGTPSYMAPEIYLRNDDKSIVCNYKVDIFAMGLTFFAMVCFDKSHDKLLFPFDKACKKEEDEEIGSLGEYVSEMIQNDMTKEEVAEFIDRFVPIESNSSVIKTRIRSVIKQMLQFESSARPKAKYILEQLENIGKKDQSENIASSTKDVTEEASSPVLPNLDPLTASDLSGKHESHYQTRLDQMQEPEAKKAQVERTPAKESPRRGPASNLPEKPLPKSEMGYQKSRYVEAEISPVEAHSQLGNFSSGELNCEKKAEEHEQDDISELNQQLTPTSECSEDPLLHQMKKIIKGAAFQPKEPPLSLKIKPIEINDLVRVKEVSEDVAKTLQRSVGESENNAMKYVGRYGYVESVCETSKKVTIRFQDDQKYQTFHHLLLEKKGTGSTSEFRRFDVVEVWPTRKELKKLQEARGGYNKHMRAAIGSRGVVHFTHNSGIVMIESVISASGIGHTKFFYNPEALRPVDVSDEEIQVSDLVLVKIDRDLVRSLHIEDNGPWDKSMEAVVGSSGKVTYIEGSRITLSLKGREAVFDREALKRLCSRDDIEVHWSITCDNCENFPLIGTRYKCVSCENYNLCKRCVIHKSSLHDIDHNMQEILRSEFLEVQECITILQDEEVVSKLKTKIGKLSCFMPGGKDVKLESGDMVYINPNPELVAQYQEEAGSNFLKAMESSLGQLGIVIEIVSKNKKLVKVKVMRTSTEVNVNLRWTFSVRCLTKVTGRREVDNQIEKLMEL